MPSGSRSLDGLARGSSGAHRGRASADPFGAGNPGTIWAFASYEPGNFTTKQFGRTDVGSQPSKGLTAHFMRGSFFTIPDTDAALTALYAYLDGNGGASGTQQLRMANDDTASSGPGDLITFSDVVTIPAGQAPGWVHFPLSAFLLTFSGYCEGATRGTVTILAYGHLHSAGELRRVVEDCCESLNRTGATRARCGTFAHARQS